MSRKRKYIKIPAQSLLRSIVNSSNGQTVEDLLRTTYVKDKYIENYPDDEIGNNINEQLTFLNLYNGMLSGKDVYVMLNVSDSMIRERVFEILANIMEVKYIVIYYLWLNI